MANPVAQAGRDARLRHGWWRSHRFLILRRCSQLLILLMFLSGPLWGVWILRGNYSASLLLDTVPLTDPLMMLESLLAGQWPAWLTWVGAAVVLTYALIGNRVFCGWVCPLNPLTDLAAWLRRRLGLRQSATLSRRLRYGILLMVLVGSALSGSLLWEWVNPVALTGRGLIHGAAGDAVGWLRGLAAAFGAGVWLLLALFLFDLLVVEHGWCGHLCPVGAMYGVIGSQGVMQISAQQREQCTRCMDCFHVCPEAQILREPLLSPDAPPQVASDACIACGRCIDVCAENVFTITSKFHSSGAKK
ncbi:Putative electron transport protein yccM [Serratia rubidaea]|uniref:Electron transport protein yccM n=2 Tax=Serratia rubidaea TaxID=61652 RepID=A0A4U9HN68_SERRU|nr:quinol dehydrogenase ferredoxin subunit NapH [Serratia rubidaea]MBD8454476.1 quinol dehydrogenase ferredoxin subunit NapH [Serratia rubidaea]MDC6109836.1 quinol dehydrogenase ferredoxin subunit NapH [Serratia rubidaea]QPR63766.1 quinol dehydrogenase ferredoxin subunit NapH [Serratia rubidaea]UJD81303.1 quinol dehydrogenase ferredoxin subunit NapH [Serratia rubidaea]UJD85864.1 quinol dehydrogenase ferredoxin subunit NapH [Serratia rubidaea]